MLRAIDGMDALRRHFRLGVNFIGSMVNRHRIEAYVLDSEGRVVCSFERLKWDETAIVDRAAAVLEERSSIASIAELAPVRSHEAPFTILKALPSLALAFLPKCPICWASYLSAVGLAGAESIARLPWMQPLLIAALLLNMSSAWLRGRATGRSAGTWLAGLGALAIIGSRFGVPLSHIGVMLTLVGSVLTARDSGLPWRRHARVIGETARAHADADHAAPFAPV
jgi:protein SCO1/2